MDAYQLPDAQGYSSMLRFLIGESEKNRQRIRDQIMDTTPTDFRNIGEMLDLLKDNGSVVIMGSQEAIEEANVAREGWLEVLKVL